MTELAIAVLWFVWSPEIEAATFPPESVCEAAYKQADAVYECAKHRWEVGGSWPLKCRMDEARMVKDQLYAAWWVTWHRVSHCERRYWLHRYRQLESR